jgi:hypothetical protein
MILILRSDHIFDLLRNDFQVVISIINKGDKSMLDKKFVAIVLVMGLIGSMCIVLGQDKDKYAQEMNEKEIAATQQGGEQLTDQSGNAPLVGSPKETQWTSGGVAQTAAQITEPQGGTIIPQALQHGATFDSYKILSSTAPPSISNYFLFIECYYGNNLVGEIYFVNDEEFESEQASNRVHAAVVNAYVPNEYILYYPVSRLDEVLGILRNEKPLAIWASGNWGGILTNGLQPVGGG